MTTRLLLVDDEEIMRMVTEVSLEQLGYAVDSACDGQEAWEKLQTNPTGYDIMLLDKHMPRMDGISLLKLMKADARLRELPVVMLTGAGRPEEIAEGLAHGAYYYLTKPATQQVLQNIIGNALVDASKRQELLGLMTRHQNSLDLVRRAEFAYRTLHQARDLALLLADASPNPQRTVNGYSELLINAVEHGNLGITYEEKSRLLAEGRWEEEIELRLNGAEHGKREVAVRLEKTPSACVVTITDQGAGFDWRKYIGFDPARAFDLHGRGIAMSRVMSFDDLEYLGNGNSVVLTVRTSA